jgi:asparagine synthase (glutamine-hydrolysing)
MSGLLVAVGVPQSALWETMLEELAVFGGDARGSWFDPLGEIALGRSYRHERGTEVELPVVHHRGCAVILDGRLARSTATRASERHSDSQAIAESYLRWGDACSAHLDGEFAFALWDSRNRRLFCACDVMGRRSIAFHGGGRVFVASTRAVTLLRHPGVSGQLDRVYAVHALCELWAQPAGTTPFESVRRLRPGFSIALECGTLLERQADRLSLEPPKRTQGAQPAYEEFWGVLDESVREQLAGARQPCILLSGGLDSACLAASAARNGHPLGAFSLVRQGGGASLDERRSIEAVLRCYPSLGWYPVEPTADPAFPDSSPDLPLPDDPVLSSPGLLPSFLRAWREMVARGFDVVADGVGGDELFDVPMRVGDLVAARSWGRAVGYVARRPDRRSILWRELAVPRMPAPWRRAWLRRENRRLDPIAPWFTPAFRHQPETRLALDQQAVWLARSTFPDLLPPMIENPPSVAATHASRLFAASVGIDVVSPLLTRAMAELAARVPPRLRVHPAHGKAFLRHASAERLPGEVRWRPKREGLYDELLWETLTSPRAFALLDAARKIPVLAEWVDLGRVGAILADRHSGNVPDVRTQERLYALLALSGWWERLKLERRSA